MYSTQNFQDILNKVIPRPYYYIILFMLSVISYWFHISGFNIFFKYFCLMCRYNYIVLPWTYSVTYFNSFGFFKVSRPYLFRYYQLPYHKFHFKFRYIYQLMNNTLPKPSALPICGYPNPFLRQNKTLC